jgi:Ca-activated chloride channel family protein
LTKQRLSWLPLVGIFFVCIAAVNPQWGFKKATVESTSAQIYILLDISNSMLAEDVAPSRLERAKRLAMDISSTFKSDKVGLIFFAGNAYLQSPLTTDWHAIQLFLSAAHPDQAGTQGTVIGEAIQLVLNSIRQNDVQNSGAIILLTDGEDHDGGAPEAVTDANEMGWPTYIVGVGTPEGAVVPEFINGFKEIKRDQQGQPVRSQLNEPLLEDLVSKGNGTYYHILQESSIPELLKKDLSELERTQAEKRSFSEHRSYYQWFLWPGLICLLLGVVLNYKHEVI